MYSNISSAARPRPSRVRACAHSALTGPIGDSMAALSQGGEIAPIEGLMPFSPMVRPSRGDTYCDPRSEWRVRPAGGLLRAIAILSAPSAGPAPMRSGIGQPTALPGHMSIAGAGQGHPRRARTQAMSANRALPGPSAVKSRPAGSGAAPAPKPHVHPRRAVDAPVMWQHLLEQIYERIRPASLNSTGLM